MKKQLKSTGFFQAAIFKLFGCGTSNAFKIAAKQKVAKGFRNSVINVIKTEKWVKRKSLVFYVVDVFTSESYKGNPLSVVFTNGNLTSTEYENISREFGYSETSFIYYSKVKKAFVIRSFTPTGYEQGTICLGLLLLPY